MVIMLKNFPRVLCGISQNFAYIFAMLFMLPIVLVATVNLHSIVSNITLLNVYLMNVLLEYIKWLLGNVYCSDLPK